MRRSFSYFPTALKSLVSELGVVLVLTCCIIVIFGVVFCVMCVLLVREEGCLVEEGLIDRVVIWM